MYPVANVKSKTNEIPKDKEARPEFGLNSKKPNSNVDLKRNSSIVGGNASKGKSQKGSRNEDNKQQKPIIVWIAVGILSIVLLAVIITLIAVAVAKPDEKKKEKRGQEVCVTHECIQAANNILTSMDDTKDPCEDFHKFACGKYGHHNQISQNNPSIHSPFVNVANKLKFELKEILEKPIKISDFKGITMARTFYRSCLAQEKEKLSLQFKPLEEFEAILASPQTFSWEEQVVNLLKRSMYSVLLIEVSQDDEDFSRNIIWMAAPPFNSIPELPKIHDKRLDDFMEKMEQVPFNKEEMKKMTIGSLKAKFKLVNWEILLSIFPINAGIIDDDVVNIVSPIQFEHILDVILNAPSSDLQYFIFYAAGVQISKFLPNSSTNNHLWKLCVADSKDLFNSIISAEYVRNCLTNEKISAVKNMSQDIKNILIEKINEADWLDNPTRRRALAKANQMNLLLGQPDVYRNEEFLMKNYKAIDIRANEYYNNSKKLLNMISTQRYSTLREANNKDMWLRSPLTVNAFYSPSQNDFFFPAAFLVFPIMSIKVPAYFNYGRLGSIVGHEITHGFDSKGHLYNERGKPEMWWTKRSKKNYKSKTVCFEKQFSNTKDIVTGHSLKGKFKLGENMADTGGIKLSYNAFLKWRSDHQSVAALPGLIKYTPEQMFFIVLATTWCELYTPASRLHYLQYEEHSLGRYRINFPLKNLKEFSDAFKCSIKAKMRLQNRCELW